MSKARLLNQEYCDSILSRAEVQSKCIRPGCQRHCTNSTESALLCMDQGSIAGWDLQIPSLVFVLFTLRYTGWRWWLAGYLDSWWVLKSVKEISQ